MVFVLNALSLLYMLVYAASGFLAARFIFPKDRLVKQIMFGMALGLMMLLWLPVLAAFIMGFNVAAQLVALGICAAVGVLCLIFGKERAKTGSFDVKKERALLFTCVPLILMGAVLMGNHYITDASNGSLHVGQCTYGDLCMHLGFITSISVQDTFPPMYSILPDTALGYPFLCDSVSSTFYTLGSTLRFATILPALYAYITVVLGVYLFFEDWFKRDSIAVLATWLFFVGGGFGFAYFFDNSKTLASLTTPEAWEKWLDETMNINITMNHAEPLDMGSMLMNGWYKTPTNFVDYGLRWVNSIADMLIPQRATLFGWSLLFPALQMLRRAAIDGERRLFITLGVIAGAMPLVHTHSFFALGLISVFLIAYKFIAQFKIKDELTRKTGRINLGYFFAFGVIAVVLAAPQLIGFTFRQSSEGGFLKLHFNWCNESDSWLWFYIKNMGFIFLLMLPAFLATKKENRVFYGGGLLIWALCEFVVFQPNTYDNNKLLFVWFALTCGIVAEFIMNAWSRLAADGNDKANDGKKNGKKPIGNRLAYGVVFAVLIGSMLLSGVMTLAREYVSGDHFDVKSFKYKESGYEVVSSELKNLTDWINDNIEPDATFLTATNHNNAIAMLTGRNIVCGAPTFLHFHGVNYYERYNDVKRMYEQPGECFRELAEKYGVDYVLFGSWEQNGYAVDYEFFRALTPVWSEGGTTLYKVG